MLMDVRFSEKQKREEEEEEQQQQGMGRPPCCDKDGIKKGPWTPEEDIILASYIKEHGPGNWRSVPTNTGLLRCSKSCRLRWTNYLRPGIKRGNFTTHEERMIVHLQALLGNKWASIASYLPQRTDNDIKNYWNTHLKKKIKKFQSSLDPLISSSSSTSQLLTRRYTDKRSKDLANQASLFRLNQTSTYASSTENISRLLEGWMKTSPKTVTTAAKNQEEEAPGDDNGNNSSMSSGNSNNNLVGTSSNQCDDLADDNTEHEGYDLISHEDFESLLSFENMSNMAWDKNSTESNYHGSQTSNTHKNISHSVSKTEQGLEDQPPLSLLEKWLLDESSAQVGEMMDLSPIF